MTGWEGVERLVQEHARAQWARVELAGDRQAAAAAQEKRALAEIRLAFATGRGSRARYRRAVEGRIREWAAEVESAQAFLARAASDPWLDAAWVEDVRRKLRRTAPALGRARRILAALDAGRPGGA